jgi:hypothetical protein
MRILVVLLTIGIAGCASPGAINTTSVGRFIHAGPTSVDAPILSARWTYGFQFNVDPASVAQVKLSCAPIPGTKFTVSGADLKIRPNGVAFWEGPILQVNEESTPWMLDSKNATTATCEAIISRVGMPDAIERAPVIFPPALKAATLMQMKEAQDFNSKLPKK